MSNARPSKTCSVALISTGGTIEKTYDMLEGVLANSVSVLDVILASLELRGTSLTRVSLMNKDSLDMSPDDHSLIARTVQHYTKTHDGVVVVHGTDRLALSATHVLDLGVPAVPVIFTGAMRPFALRNTDAPQNVAEALLAARLLHGRPGVYLAMHNQVLQFPGVIKDPTTGSFRYAS